MQPVVLRGGVVLCADTVSKRDIAKSSGARARLKEIVQSINNARPRAGRVEETAIGTESQLTAVGSRRRYSSHVRDVAELRVVRVRLEEIGQYGLDIPAASFLDHLLQCGESASVSFKSEYLS